LPACMHRSNGTQQERISDERWFGENGHLAGFGVQIDPETPAAFAETVRPLELALGKPLNGPGRAKCLRAFAENPEAFGRLASEALARGRVNPPVCSSAWSRRRSIVLSSDHVVFSWPKNSREEVRRR
jgi:hypothetical protein